MVVLDKKLFARAVKDKRKRTQDKDALGAFEMEFETKFVELKDKLETFLDR
jgi:DNA-directed RNA polymerase subunit beta